MRRYLFILEITPVEAGKAYAELPSHSTLMSRFFSDLTPIQLNEAVRLLFEQTAAIQLVFGETEQLGPKKLTVHMVDYSTELMTLHNELRLLLDSVSVEYEYPQFIGDGHKPHVTARDDKYFKAGDSLTVTNAFLVEVVDHQRVIRSQFSFKK